MHLCITKPFKTPTLNRLFFFSVFFRCILVLGIDDGKYTDIIWSGHSVLKPLLISLCKAEYVFIPNLLMPAYLLSAVLKLDI